MAIALRNATYSYAGLTPGATSPWTLTATLPTVADGDLVICGFEGQADSPGITTPAGWTQLYESTDSDRWIGYKIWHTGDPTTVALSFPRASGSPKSLAVLASFSGVDPTTPIDVSSVVNGTSAALINLTGVTTSTDNNMLVAMYLARDGGTVTGAATAIAVPGFTQAVFYSSGGGGGTDGWIGYKIASPAGATGDLTLSLTQSAYDNPYTGLVISLALPATVGIVRPDPVDCGTAYPNPSLTGDRVIDAPSVAAAASIPTPNLIGGVTGSSRFAGDVAPGYIRTGAYTANGTIHPSQDLWPNFVGQPTLVAGVTITGTPVTRFETNNKQGGGNKPMGLRRLFYKTRNDASQGWNSLVSDATAAIAAGRLPWVSIKPPWVSGTSNDADFDWLIGQLAALPGPVWFTISHEPENDNAVASAPNFRATQTRWKARMDLYQANNPGWVRNIAFAPIWMDWSFDPTNTNCPYHPTSPLYGGTFDVGATWWVDGIWDFFGIDHYITNPGAAGPARSSDTKWTNWRQFARSKGLDIALGEYANHDPVNEAELTYAHNVMLGIQARGAANDPGSYLESPGRILGVAYFDGTGGLAVSSFPDSTSTYLYSYTAGTPNTNPVYHTPQADGFTAFNTDGLVEWRRIIGLDTSLLIDENGYGAAADGIVRPGAILATASAVAPQLRGSTLVSPSELLNRVRVTTPVPNLIGSARVDPLFVNAGTTLPVPVTIGDTDLGNAVGYTTPSPLTDAFGRFYFKLDNIGTTKLVTIASATGVQLHSVRLTPTGRIDLVGSRDGAEIIFHSTGVGAISLNRWYGMEFAFLHSSWSAAMAIYDLEDKSLVYSVAGGVTIPGTGDLVGMSKFSFQLNPGVTTGYTAGHAVGDQFIPLVSLAVAPAEPLLAAADLPALRSLSGQNAVFPTPLSVAASIGVPGVAGSGRIALGGGVTATTALPVPTTTGLYAVWPASLASAVAIPAPTIKASTIIAAVPLAATTSLPVPTLTGGIVDVRIDVTPPLAVRATTPTATLNGEYRVTPGPLNTTGTTPSPSLYSGGRVQPAALLITTTTPSTTFIGDGKVVPTPVGINTTTIPGPTLRSDGVISPAVLAASGGFPALLLKTGTVQAPAVLEVVAGYDVSLLSGSGHVPVASGIALPTQLPVPTVQGETLDTLIEPTQLDAVCGTPTPTLPGDGVSIPPVLVSTTTINPPAVATGTVITPTALAVAASPVDPRWVVGSTKITPTPVGASAAGLAGAAQGDGFSTPPAPPVIRPSFPSVSFVGDGKVNVVGPLSISITSYFPSLYSNGVASAAAIAVAVGIPAPAVLGNGGVAAAPVASAAAFYLPTLTSGGGATPQALSVNVGHQAVTLAGAGTVAVTGVLTAGTTFPNTLFAGEGGAWPVPVSASAQFVSFTPNLMGTGIVRPAALAVGCSVEQPSVVGFGLTTPLALTSGSTLYGYSSSGGAVEVDPGVAAMAAFPLPTLLAGTVLSLASVLNARGAFPPVGMGGNGVVAPPGLDVTTEHYPTTSVSGGVVDPIAFQSQLAIYPTTVRGAGLTVADPVTVRTAFAALSLIDWLSQPITKLKVSKRAHATWDARVRDETTNRVDEE